jgi:hypothetical protein
MPIRPPRPNESEQAYIHYCTPIEIDAGRSQQQALAICYSIYRRKTGKKDTQDTQEGNMTEITVLIDDEGTDPSWEQTLVTDGKGLEEWEVDFLTDLSLADDTKAVMKTEGDGQHPSSHYLVVERPDAPSTWHLRVRDVSGKVDHNLMGAAWAALHGGYRGNKYQGPQKAEALAKLKGLYKQENMATPGGEKASVTGGEQATVDENLVRQVANTFINAVSGLIKGGKKEVEEFGTDAVLEDLDDPDITTDMDFYPPGTTTGEKADDDDFDESLITWLDPEEASQYEAPDGYKILGILGDGDELEFVLEPLEGTKDLEESDSDEGDEGDDPEDSKAGRRVRSSRVEDLRRLKKEISEALQALDAVIGWADYAEKEEDGKEEGPALWMSEKSLQALSDHGSVAFSFKARDGSPWWMQWTMNSFKDREGEIFSTKSISDYVTRHESDDKKGEFWFWHVPGTKFGDVQWEAQVGRFLVQAGPFGDDPIATHFKQFFDDYPDGHPDIAPFGWGTSHRYEYKSTDRQDGIYDWFELKESTVLPWHEASNPWSPRPHTMEVTTVNEKQKAALREIGGDDFVTLIERTGQARTKELEASAIDYKANGSYATRIRSVAAKCGKTEVKAALDALCKELDKQFPPKPSMPPEEEEEEEGKGKESKDDGSKANTLKDLGEKLSLIAGKAGDEVKAALETIAKEMTGAGGEKETKEDAGEAKKDASPDPRYVTKDDFKDAIGAMISTIREELAEGLKAIQDQVASTQEQVKDLSRTDEAKIAEKAEGVPTASLEDIMSELLGTDTQIKANSKLAKRQPKQTDQTPDITGVPGLDWLISQPDG